MIEPDFSRCRSVLMPDGSLSPPLPHVIAGVKKILEHPYFFNADTMGLMKSAQAVIAACFLYEAGVVDNVIIVAPHACKSVWTDPDLGQLRLHLFDTVPAIVHEQAVPRGTWTHGPDAPNRLTITVTNYERVRGRAWLAQLLPSAGQRTLLILDETTAIQNWKAKQTRACHELRRRCGRVLLLNGTPGEPLALFSQANMMSSRILECPFVTHFRARYEVQEVVKKRDGKVLLTPYGKPVMKHAAWTNLDDLQRRMAPYVMRRLAVDCLDLPEKLPAVTITVDLNASWPRYVEMKKELVVWLKANVVATAGSAAIKAMRLAQITSGFLGGVEAANVGELSWMDACAGLNKAQRAALPDYRPDGLLHNNTMEVGREKLDAFLAWLDVRLDEDPSLKLLVQARFRPEIARAVAVLRDKYKVDVGEIVGGQTKAERADALKLLHPQTAPAGPAIVVASSAGTLGLNLTAAHTVARLSRDFSLTTWLQGEARVHRPGQVHPVSYFDFVARGPKGQKTVDHLVLAALAAKQDVAAFTASAWIEALGKVA